MKILVLGMNSTSRSELSYEGRIIHKLAELPDVEVDYMTDAPLTYEKEPVLKKPERLNHVLYAKGSTALANTPRTFHPKDVKWIVNSHHFGRFKLDPEYKHALGERGPSGIVYGADPGITELSDGGYDIIFGTAQTAIDMGTWIKQVLDIPFAVQILDVPLWRITQTGPSQIYRNAMFDLPYLPEGTFQNYVGEWSYWFSKTNEIDRIITIMDIVKRQMVDTVKLPAEKISVVKHGSIDYDTIMWHRNEFAIEKKNQVIVLNRHTFHKGVDQSIVICSIIKQNLPDTKFVFVSDGDKWYSDMLQDFAKRLLGNNVEFKGWLDNVSKFKLLRESKVLLDQEWPEGFGGVCLAEAVFCDAVPIVWDTLGKREVTNNGSYAAVVPMGDFATAADIAVQVLNGSASNEWTPEVFEEARQWTKENRSVESHAKSLLEIFKSMVKK